MSRHAIDLETDILPVSDFRASTSDTIDKVRQTGRPVVLTQHGRSAAVLVSVRTWQAMVDELEELRDVHRGRADAEAGRAAPHDDVQQLLLAGLRK